MSRCPLRVEASNNCLVARRITAWGELSEYFGVQPAESGPVVASQGQHLPTLPCPSLPRDAPPRLASPRLAPVGWALARVAPQRLAHRRLARLGSLVTVTIRKGHSIHDALQLGQVGLLSDIG
jgi:hypothetical protein